MFVRGRGDSAIQHHSKTLVARLRIGLQRITAAPLVSGVGIFRVGLRTNYRAHQQYRRNNEALHRNFPSERKCSQMSVALDKCFGSRKPGYKLEMKARSRTTFALGEPSELGP